MKNSPSGFNTKIKTIELNGKAIAQAFAPMSVTITLNDEIDISRGDVIAKPNNLPNTEQDVDIMLCWMNQKPLNVNAKFFVKHTTKEVRGVVKEIQYKLDINSLQKVEGETQLAMNDIARIKLRTSQPLLFDSYRKNRITGSIILVDEGTFETVGAGMIV